MPLAYWTDKRNNLNQFLKIWSQMGFVYLNNDRIPAVHRRRQGHALACGVENWAIPFSRYGKCRYRFSPGQACIILLSRWLTTVTGGEVLQSTPDSPDPFRSCPCYAIRNQDRKNEWVGTIYLSGIRRIIPASKSIFISSWTGYLGFPGRIGLRPVIIRIHPAPKPLANF